MNKKTSIIAGAILAAIAVFFGFVLVNKGDGPVMGMILSNSIIQNSEAFEKVQSEPGIYRIVEKEFNKFKTKYAETIPAGKDLYAALSIVECPKGTKLTANWIKDGGIIKEETKLLETDQKGMVFFELEDEKVSKGNVLFELYAENEKVFELQIAIG